MSQATEKLHLTHPFCYECQAVITIVSEKGIVTDRSVAFPEGGGQEGDCGFLERIDNNKSPLKVNFSPAKKGNGRSIFLNDFPVIQVDNPIYHPVDQDALSLFHIGDKVKITIDVQRRASLTVAHSGLHLVLMIIEKNRPTISQSIKGCHITPEYARIDFYTDQRFEATELDKISTNVHDLINQNQQIVVYPHEQEKEAWYWKCLDYAIPCGGTHLPTTKYINQITLKRKNLGKNMERITVYFVDPIRPIEKYHKA